jgi:hypothetical protein
MKDLVCTPPPYNVNGFFWSFWMMKFETTRPSSLFMRSPNVLKIRYREEKKMYGE